MSLPLRIWCDDKYYMNSDEEGTFFVWDDLFASDQDAIDRALNLIETEGLSAFRDNGNVIPFPKR